MNSNYIFTCHQPTCS